jgi:2-polyprenyl-6-methoxyphenol hydroxylase-like FAD-dependent oxidoreductase
LPGIIVPSVHSRRALIVGGSVGGLFAANLLRANGWDVAVFERAAGDLATRGAAIGLTVELLEVMQGLGLRLQSSAGTNVRSYVALAQDGSIALELPRLAATGAWSHIYRPLREALPDACYRAAAALQRIAQDGEGVTAIFADGSRATGDLLIGADGIYSTVRQQLLPEARPEYAGYVAWRGVLDEADVLPGDRDLVFNHLIFCFPPGELLLSIPIPADDADVSAARGRRCCYIWYRPVDFATELPRLCTDASGKQHGVTIPPPLIRPELVRDLKADAHRLLPPVAARMVEFAERPLFQAIFDLASARLAFGRVALLGDAAFVARPHVVAGVTKAALDAQCLADVLSDSAIDLDGALARYERERRDLGQKIIAHARYLGAYLAKNAENIPPDAPSDRRPDIMLRDYGAPHLFRRT